MSAFAPCIPPPRLRPEHTTFIAASAFSRNEVKRRSSVEAPATRRSRLLCMSEGAPPSLREQLTSEDSAERLRAVTRIDEVKSVSEQVEILVPIAETDKNPQVRYTAISRLSNFNPQALSASEGALILETARSVLASDEEPTCQAGAADLIAGLKLQDGFDDLVETFNSTKDWMLKFSIAASMGEMSNPKSFEFLETVLNGEEELEGLVLVGAIGSIGELGDARGIPLLEKYMNHEDASVKERAEMAMELLSKSQ